MKLIQSTNGRVSDFSPASKLDACSTTRSIPHQADRLRVGFIAGCLVQDGAEKQLVYMAKALLEAGADVRVYCLTSGDFHERTLAELGILTECFGGSRSRVLRLARLWTLLRRFRPHVVQAAHFFMNPYAAIAAWRGGAVVVGCARGDLLSDLADNGRWGSWGLQLVPGLLVNSETARRNALAIGMRPEKVHTVANVIDLAEFDARSEQPAPLDFKEAPIAIAVGRLVHLKRFDHFLLALAQARVKVPGLKGLIVGEGPERLSLEQLARELKLFPEHVQFLGRRNDVPAVLRRASLLVLTSAYEGFPNVILEAMAARLPVLTTPAGYAASVVQQDVSGFVVPFNDVDALAARMVQLCQDPMCRQQLGLAGRRLVEKEYSYDRLGGQLLSVYRTLGVRYRTGE